MNILNSFIQQINIPTFTQTLNSAINKLGAEINCVRIGIVQEFYPDTLTVKVKIASKRVLNHNPDGTQEVRDYAPIYAKVCFCNPFITNPLKLGDEVILLFNDRELETWFINGQSNTQNHMRMHDLTDAIAIAGIRSLPNMIEILTNALHLFYGNSDIQIQDSQININTTTLNIAGNTAVTGNTLQTGDITATNLSATAAASGSFSTPDGKVVTVVNGIITVISQ